MIIHSHHILEKKTELRFWCSVGFVSKNYDTNKENSTRKSKPIYEPNQIKKGNKKHSK